MIAGILVPGVAYPVRAPLLDLADDALRDLGVPIEAIEWTVPDGLPGIGSEPFVRAHVAAALHRLTMAEPEAQPVIIAKSFGTHAAALAAERKAPAIWLTPLLTNAAIVAAIARNPAPALLPATARYSPWTRPGASIPPWPPTRCMLFPPSTADMRRSSSPCGHSGPRRRSCATVSGSRSSG